MSGLIKAESIKTESIFYNDSESEQVKILSEALLPKQFERITKSNYRTFSPARY